MQRNWKDSKDPKETSGAGHAYVSDHVMPNEGGSSASVPIKIKCTWNKKSFNNTRTNPLYWLFLEVVVSNLFLKKIQHKVDF